MEAVSPQYDVVIVGAGCAGLYAAYLLNSLGVKTVVVEAQDHIGGRIVQTNTFPNSAMDKFAPFPIDIGAEFLHGEFAMAYDLYEKNKWFLSELYNFTSPAAEEGAFVDGKLIDWACPSHRMSKLRDVIDEMSAADLAKPDMSLDEFFAKHGLTPKSDRGAYMLAQNFVGRTAATEMAHMGLNESGREERDWPHGRRNYRPDRTFAELNAHLAKGLNIVTGCPVQLVDYRNAKNVKVVSKCGRVFSCRYAIVTVPLPIIRDNHLQFSPALPESRMQAWRTIGWGPGIKVICKFRSEFYAHKPYRLIITDSDDIAQFWFTGPATRSPEFRAAHPEIVNRRDKDGAVCIATAFITGSLVEKTNKRGLDATVRIFLDMLDRAYPDAPQKPSSVFCGAIMYDWGTNEYVRGAYSYPGMEGTGSRQTVAEPLANCLFFAGEATNTMCSGTVQAAMQTGARAVSEVCMRMMRKLPGNL